MQPRGTLPLSVWGGIWLLLLTADAAEKPPVYAALHDSVQLDIPKYPNAENYQVTWTDASSTKIAWFKNNDKITYSNEDLCNCTLHKNGSLYIKSMDTKGEIHYKVEVYNKETGKGLSTEVIKVIVQEKVKEPTLTYNCTTKKINCIATAGSDPKIQITWDKKPMTEWKVGSPVDITFKDKTGTVTCSVKNVVSQMSRTENIKCHQELDIFLMLSIAGAAAAFLIFLILLGYCVRRRMANTRRIRQHRAGVPALRRAICDLLPSLQWPPRLSAYARPSAHVRAPGPRRGQPRWRRQPGEVTVPFPHCHRGKAGGKGRSGKPGVTPLHSVCV
ncbi:T-cell surface antigen CD2 isoform X3 [Ascaphus truei]|uniref:T-cell surface antigen CD2 isoform X3 n=1 Tax=Ascaphus truei TaxID=8439 RepID=UPI003F5A2605